MVHGLNWNNFKFKWFTSLGHSDNIPMTFNCVLDVQYPKDVQKTMKSLSLKSPGGFQNVLKVLVIYLQIKSQILSRHVIIPQEILLFKFKSVKIYWLSVKFDWFKYLKRGYCKSVKFHWLFQWKLTDLTVKNIFSLVNQW